MTPDILAQLIGDGRAEAPRGGDGPAWIVIGPAARAALAPAADRADRPRFDFRIPPGATVHACDGVHQALALLGGRFVVAGIVLDAPLLTDRPAAAIRALRGAAPGVTVFLWGNPRSVQARQVVHELEVPIWDPDATDDDWGDDPAPPRDDLPRTPRQDTAPRDAEAHLPVEMRRPTPADAAPPMPPPDRAPAPRPRVRKGAFAEGCLARIQDLGALVDYVLDTLQAASGATRASLMLRDPVRGTLGLTAARGMRENLVGRTRQSLGAGIAGRVAALGRPTVGHGSAGGHRRYAGAAYAVLPLGRGADCQGVVNLTAFPGDRVPDIASVRNWLRLCRRAATALDHARRLRDAERLSTRDTLTGLPNRRAFERALDRELERARRSGTRLGLAMVDVDHFKRLNDELGHKLGDAALRQVAGRLAEGVRETDLVCRWGGEEFAILLPGLVPAPREPSGPGKRPDPAAEALIALDRVRQGVCAKPLALRAGLPSRRVTVSIGVAVFPEHAAGGAGVEGLIELADQALYAAKEAGRNCVRAAP